MQSSIPNGPAPADEFAYRHALDIVGPELAALQEDDLSPINLDIPETVKTVRGAIAEIMPFKEQVAAAMPSFNLALFDKLETYAMALGYANTRYRASTMPVEPLEELQAEAVVIREQLLSDLNALAFRGLVDGDRLSEVKRTNGYNNLAQEVMLMAELARKNWSAIASRTLLTPEELSKAENVAARLVKAAGEKDQIKPRVAAEQDVRRRAYTLLLNAYDEVRRAITFVRWKEDDVDDIAPSLFQKGRRKHEKAAAEPVAPAAPSAPAAAQPAAAQPASSVATSTGLPDEDPIIRR